MFLKVTRKFFCKNAKLEEAKKRAMAKYEEMLVEKKVQTNRILESNLKEQSLKQRQKEGDIHIPEIKSYKSKEKESNIENLVDNFEYIPKAAETPQATQTSHQILIDNNILLYKINNYFKKQVDEEGFVTIFQLGKDKNYERFLQFIKKLLVLLFFVQTYRFYRKEKRSLLHIAGFYSCFLFLFLITRRVGTNTVTKITLKENLVRFYCYNDIPVLEEEIKHLVQINSKRKNSHVILIQNITKMKSIQLYLPKNAMYDRILISSLCHPKVFGVKLI